MRKDNLKARLAYSTVSQLSYVTLGAMLATSMGVMGGAMQIAAHALGAVALAQRALASLEATRRSVRPSALCHNDLVAGNILETDGQGLVLIDWEYAGIGDPFFDLAVVVEHHGVRPPVARGFLATYLGRAAQADEVARLERQCRFYGHLLDLWRLRIATAAGC